MSDISDSLIRQMLLEYLASQGASPEQAQLMGMIPQTDAEGDPVSLTSMLNQTQDIADLWADPMFQGAGGVGGYSQQAFQPTVNYEMVDSPEYQQWRNYLNPNNQTSFEGMIANGLQGGDTPYSALRKIQLKVAEQPDGELAQMMATFFPAMDDMGMPTGEIDWVAAGQGATKIDEIRSKIPQLGGAASYEIDGQMVPGGEIMEIDGQLVRRTEEPSELMQKFNELGLPSPFAEYTTQDFLPPDWSDEPYRQAAQESLAAWQAMRGGGERPPGPNMLEQMWERLQQGPGPSADRERGGGEEGPEENRQYVGPNQTGTELLTGGQGIGRTEPPAEQRYDPLSGAMMSIEPVAPSLEEMYRIQSPGEFLDWYMRNANQMTDAERWETIFHAQDESFGGPGGAHVNAEWSQVVNQLNDDLTQTRDSGSPAATIGNFFADRPVTSGDAAFQEAQLMTDANEFASHVASSWDLLSDDQRMQLGTYAADRVLSAGDPAQRDIWNDLGGRIVRGDYQAPTQGGGPGSHPAALKPNKSGTYGEPRGGDEPQPDPRDYLWQQMIARANGEEPPPDEQDALYQQFLRSVGAVDSSYGPQPVAPEVLESWNRYRGLPSSGEARGARDLPPALTDAMRAAVLPSGQVRQRDSEPGSPLPRSESVDWYPASGRGSPNLPRSERVDWYPESTPGRMRTGEQLPASERVDWYPESTPGRMRTGEQLPASERVDWYPNQRRRPTAAEQRLQSPARREYLAKLKKTRKAHLDAYGAEHGYAMGTAWAAQRAGVTPLQQVYAQRMQNILNAGIPLGNQPGLVQY